MALFTKELSKPIMTRSRPQNNSLKNWNDASKFLYTKQINYCLSLLTKTNERYLDERLGWET